MLRWTLAVLHLLALGMGMGALGTRARELLGPLDADGVRRVLRADTAWGVAALLWVSTGLWRWLGGVEKGTDYYLQNHLFLAKMGLFVLILVLEIAPMIALVRWRMALAKNQPIDTHGAKGWARTSMIQGMCLVLMVICAAGMARGFGVAGGGASGAATP
jgi:putative membrane protein